jgi:hypothetical protein
VAFVGVTARQDRGALPQQKRLSGLIADLNIAAGLKWQLQWLHPISIA